MSALRPLFVVAGIGNGSGLLLAVLAPLRQGLTSTQVQGLLQRKGFVANPSQAELISIPGVCSESWDTGLP